MERTFTLKTDDGIATLLFDAPGKSVNLLTPEILEEFETLLDEIAAQASDLSGLIILSGKPDSFIAGADIGIIEGLTGADEASMLSREGQRILDKLASLPLPVVAAIHGACLGGGLELALACTYRVASDGNETVLGLPETHLGIIPGFGGTQRLPQVVGLTEAIRMITTGSRVYSAKAKRVGLVDEVVVRENMLKAAKRRIRDGGKAGLRERLRWKWLTEPSKALLEGTLPGRRLILKRAREQVQAVTRGNYPAPLAAIDAVETGVVHGFRAGLEAEARLLGEMVVTDVARNLLRVFRLRERASRIDTTRAQKITRIGVVGAGVMGTGITLLAAESGFWVRLINHSTRGLGRALREIAQSVERDRKKGIRSAAAASWIEARVSYDHEIRGLGGSQVVVEAVTERLDVKKAVLADIARATRGDTIIVSNTSSLSVSAMAEAVAAPERMAGLHFFNPVDKMPLVEVVRGERTSEETVVALMALAKRLGKIPVVVSDRPGFLVNRILMAGLNEAARFLQEGQSVEAVDAALLDFGLPMGAFRLLDVVGIDVAYHAADNLYAAFGERFHPSPVLGALIRAERLGQKNGKGFYRYDRGKRRPDPELRNLIRGHVKFKEDMSVTDMVERTLLAMINEGAYCLEEAVVDTPDAVDVAMILGSGFPPYTGGLLRYADRLGVVVVTQRLEELAQRYGERFRPAPLLRGKRDEGKGFYQSRTAVREEVRS